jgi:hypothetical protein
MLILADFSHYQWGVASVGWHLWASCPNFNERNKAAMSQVASTVAGGGKEEMGPVVECLVAGMEWATETADGKAEWLPAPGPVRPLSGHKLLQSGGDNNSRTGVEQQIGCSSKHSRSTFNSVSQVVPHRLRQSAEENSIKQNVGILS